MPFADFTVPMKRIFWGSLLLVVCCALYLAWWIVAFRPNAAAAKGVKTGLLLLGAVTAGIAAVALMLSGITAAPRGAALFPPHSILWGGVAAYLILLAGTWFLWKRPVTTELILIVGWAMLELSAVDALYGAGNFRRGPAIGLSVMTGLAAVLCLVCYVLYYRLGQRESYTDGMIPLITGMLATAATAAAMLL